MIVEAPTQRAAEATAAQRGMMVEQCVPANAVATPPSVPTPARPYALPPDTERVYGLTFSNGFAMYLIGLLLSPALIGIPLIIWGYLARSRIAENRRAIASLAIAKRNTPKR